MFFLLKNSFTGTTWWEQDMHVTRNRRSDAWKHIITQTTVMTLRIQSPCQMMIGVYNHLLNKVFRFSYPSQRVIGSLGWNIILPFIYTYMWFCSSPLLHWRYWCFGCFRITTPNETIVGLKRNTRIANIAGPLQHHFTCSWILGCLPKTWNLAMTELATEPNNDHFKHQHTWKKHSAVGIGTNRFKCTSKAKHHIVKAKLAFHMLRNLSHAWQAKFPILPIWFKVGPKWPQKPVKKRGPITPLIHLTGV